MKNVKKLLSFLLAMLLVFSLAATGFATENEAPVTYPGNITINDAISGQTYSAYQIMYLESYSPVPDAANGAYAYKANAAWLDWLKDQTDYVNVDEQGYVTWVNADTSNDGDAIKDFAQAAMTQLEGKTAVDTKTADATTVTFSNLPLGYYLLDTTTGTLCALNTTNPTAIMRDKNKAPENKKEIKIDETTFVTENNANIGDTVNFQVTITAQPGAENYVFHDTMTDGLTFNNDIVIKLGTSTVPATSYDVETDKADLADDNCTFEIIFTEGFCNSITEESEIVITYSATLNENAVIGGEGNINSSELSYGENNDLKTTPDSSTTTYTFDFDVFKYKEGENAAKDGLANAQFKLSTDKEGTQVINLIKGTSVNTADVYRVATDAEVDDNTIAKITTITTGTSGKFIIQGLAAGTYYLTETKAPDGYHKLAAPVKIVIDDKGNVYQDPTDENSQAVQTIEILNKTGALLPSTGGIGTTVFYILGAVLVMAAVVLLITKKRMSGVE